MFDTELFINEIQSRPQLWNLKLKEYSNSDIKGKLWIEIASVTVENWDELNNADKNKEVKELQKKWKSIREAFTREVRLQKLPSGSGKRTRKRYVYFDQLLFLLDTLEDRLCRTLTNIDDGEVEGGETENDENHDLDTTATPTLAVSNVRSLRRSEKRKGNSFEDEVLRHIKSRSTGEENDGDRLFLLSLLSMFRKFSDRTKLWTRMKITKVMQQALGYQTPITVYQPLSGSYNPPAYPQQNYANFSPPVYTTGYRIQQPASSSTSQPAPSPTVIQPAVSPACTDLSSASHTSTAWSPPSNDSSLFDVL